MGAFPWMETTACGKGKEGSLPLFLGTHLGVGLSAAPLSALALGTWCLVMEGTGKNR